MTQENPSKGLNYNNSLEDAALEGRVDIMRRALAEQDRLEKLRNFRKALRPETRGPEAADDLNTLVVSAEVIASLNQSGEAVIQNAPQAYNQGEVIVVAGGDSSGIEVIVDKFNPRNKSMQVHKKS